MLVNMLNDFRKVRKGEELKAPHHASAAATRDNYVPYSRHWQPFFYSCYLYINNAVKL
jgi:hypothetical protein